MINSMTGYGGAQCEINGATYAVEIKSVNNRYFKSSIRLPESVAFLEESIDRLLRDNLSRGTVTYVLRLKDVSADVLFDIDEPALNACLEKLSRVASSSGVETRIDIASLLELPGIVQAASPDEGTVDQLREKVIAVSQEATDRLKKMRAAEGAALAADLESNCEDIKADLEQIDSRRGLVVESHRERLNKRVGSILADVGVELDQDVLAREVAIFAERADVSEELARLDSHLQQFKEVCRNETVAGRRLDFLSQEMFREANTIASKASDAEIIHWVVDIKCRIDRMKEQVQNVE